MEQTRHKSKTISYLTIALAGYSIGQGIVLVVEGNYPSFINIILGVFILTLIFKA